jgi:hypothetical protein
MCWLLGCSSSESADREVVVCIIDEFSSEDSHGELVKRFVKDYSFDKCRLKNVDVRERQAYGENGYLVALGDVLNYVLNNPDELVLVNISLGSYERNPIEEDLVNKLIENNAVIVASAGNDNIDRKLFPASFAGTVAVAATWANKKAEYSNYGDHIDLSAQGLAEITISNREPIPSVTPAERIYYHIKGGTSFAAPRITGLLAYLLVQRPGLNPEQALSLIKEHSRPIGDDYFGKGYMGAGEMTLFSTLIAEDPLFKKVLISQIVAFLLMLLLLYIFDIEKGLFYFGLIILVPILIGVNLILSSSWGLIKGGIAGTVTTCVAYLFVSACYVAVKMGRGKHVIEE